MNDVTIEHTKSSRACRLCPGKRGGPGPCDHSEYSPRYRRFVHSHFEAFQAAYLDGNRSAAASQLERLNREYQSLPPRHRCTCRPQDCPYYQLGVACMECRRLHDQRVKGKDVAVEIGRTAMIHAPTPSPLMLDMSMEMAS